MILYFAGPLFTRAEIDFNSALADYFTARGHKANLPQEFCRGLQEHEIFSACVDYIGASDVVLVNCDGADVDSGTAFEAGWAYARNIPIVSYRTDFRSGGDCMEGVNLMIGKAAWKHVAGQFVSVSHLAEALEREINNLREV